MVKPLNILSPSERVNITSQFWRFMITAICNCNTDIESTKFFLLHCELRKSASIKLLSTIAVSTSTHSVVDNDLVMPFLHGSKYDGDNINRSVLKATIN